MLTLTTRQRAIRDHIIANPTGRNLVGVPLRGWANTWAIEVGRLEQRGLVNKTRGRNEDGAFWSYTWVA